MTRSLAVAALLSMFGAGLAAQLRYFPLAEGSFSARPSPAEVSTLADTALIATGYARIGSLSMWRKEKDNRERTGLDALRAEAAKFGGDLVTSVTIDSAVTETSVKRKCTRRTFWVGNPMSRCDETQEYDQVRNLRESSATVWRQDQALARAQADSLRRNAQAFRDLGVMATWSEVEQAVEAAVRDGDQNGAVRRLAALLDLGAPDADPYGQSALHVAAEARGAWPQYGPMGEDAERQLAVVRLLLARGIPVDVRDKWFGATPLMWAVDRNRVEAVKALLDAGADVNAQSTKPFRPDDLRHKVRTPLGIALERFARQPGEYEAMVALLRERGGKN